MIAGADGTIPLPLGVRLVTFFIRGVSGKRSDAMRCTDDQGWCAFRREGTERKVGAPDKPLKHQGADQNRAPKIAQSLRHQPLVKTPRECSASTLKRGVPLSFLPQVGPNSQWCLHAMSSYIASKLPSLMVRCHRIAEAVGVPLRFRSCF